MHVKTAKVLLVVKTLIKNKVAATLFSSHESIKQQPHQSAVMNQEIKIIALSKNAFQKYGCTLKFLPQKMHLKTDVPKIYLIKEILTDKN